LGLASLGTRECPKMPRPYHGRTAFLLEWALCHEVLSGSGMESAAFARNRQLPDFESMTAACVWQESPPVAVWSLLYKGRMAP